MKPFKSATRTLPEAYQKLDGLDLTTNQGLALILNLGGLGLLFGLGWLFLQSLAFLRPEYLSSENILVITGMREFWRAVLLLAVSTALMIVLHEGLHGLLFWIITGHFPKFGFRGFYAYASAPEWYIPRGAYVLIALTPVVLITVMGMAAVTIVPLNLVPGVLLLVSMNAAGALGDIITAIWLAGKPAGILVYDYGDGVRIYGPGDGTDAP
jgi:hypothetical protein